MAHNRSRQIKFTFIAAAETIIICIAIVASKQRKPLMMQPHFDLLRADCCFQDHGQGQSRSVEHSIHKPHRSLSDGNTIQSSVQHPGHYKANSYEHSRWTHRYRLLLFLPPSKNPASRFPHSSEWHRVRNLMQDMFYSSKTSKHRTSSALSGETAGTSG